MSIIHGRNLKIYSGNGAIIGAAKSCSIHTQGDVIETAGASSGTARTFTPGRTSWTIEINHLVTSDEPTGKLLATNSIVSISVMNGNSQILSGTAIITEATIVATKGSLANGSIRLQGTGPLNQ